MKKGKFRFGLGDHVFILGRPGRCIVIGRGLMKFSSGGKRNMYQIIGGQWQIVQEDALVTPAEMRAITTFDGE